MVVVQECQCCLKVLWDGYETFILHVIFEASMSMQSNNCMRFLVHRGHAVLLVWVFYIYLEIMTYLSRDLEIAK